MWTLWNKIYLMKTAFENFMKWGLKGGISIDADSGPPRYVLWCFGSRSHDFFTFIQIGSGHTVSKNAEQLNNIPTLLFSVAFQMAPNVHLVYC